MTQTAEAAPRKVDKPPFSREQLAALKSSFDESGYLVFENVVSKDALATLRTRLIETFEGSKQRGGLFSGGGLISGHLNCFPGAESRFVYDTLVERGIVDVVRTLMPSAVDRVAVGCNLNFPKSVAQHYHADGLFKVDFLVVNVAAVDTEIANGAIDVLPGTHKKFYKFWRFAVERAARLTTRIPMKQGDVLVRTSNLWHRGMPNFTNVPRPMLAVTFGEGRGLPVDEAYAIHGGKITFEPNWFKPNLLGRIRERTFVKLPAVYSAYRFATSLVDGDKGYATW